PDSACPHRRQAEGLQSSEERSFSGGTRGRNALRWPGCPPRFRGDGGLGGFRFRPIGSEDGGLDELVEFWLSLASSSAIRFSREPRRAKTAAWASGGMVFQRDSGIGGSGIIQGYYALAA